MPNEDRDLYLLIGEIKGGQESLTGEVRAGNKASGEGRLRLHEAIDELRIRTEQQLKEMSDRNDDQFRELTRRVETAQRTAEVAVNQITTVAPTITEHQNLRLKAEGAVVAVNQIGRAIWALGGTIIAAVLAGATYVVHSLSNGPRP